MNEKLLRMAADMFIPVGEREVMIANMMEGVYAAKAMHEGMVMLREQTSLLVLRIDQLAQLITPEELVVTPKESLEVVEEVATEVAEEVAMATVIEMKGEPVNLEDGFVDTRENKGDV